MVTGVVTDELLTENTPIAAVLAVAIVGLLAWRHRPARFRALPWSPVASAAAVMWGLALALSAPVERLRRRLWPPAGRTREHGERGAQA